MGRSRGGLTSKIHALVDAEGRPVALKITEGQAHDGRAATDMLDGLGAGQTLLGDRAYDSDALRERLANTTVAIQISHRKVVITLLSQHGAGHAGGRCRSPCNE